MYISGESDVIEVTVTNTHFKRGDWHDIEIANYEIYSHPDRRYHYDTELRNLSANTYINNAKPLTGLFENITFKKGTFFDCSLFKRVIFKDCTFEDIDIRWCRFEKCQFINCKGTIKYARRTTWTKDCIFDNTDIQIKFVDEFIYINSRRHGSGYCNIELK